MEQEKDKDRNIANKRQVYIWPENKEFYDKLPNKSKLVNLLIRKYRQENEEEE